MHDYGHREPRPGGRWGGGFWHRPFFGGYGYRGCGGCFGNVAFAVVMVVAVVVMALTVSMGSCSAALVSCSATPSSQSTAITSDTKREKLSSDLVTETGYYTDVAGDWIYDEDDLLEGMEKFYKKTGVQPYVYILENGSVTDEDELADMAEELYGELFTDEGHFLLVFCDDGDGGYYYGYLVGDDALSVMDSEALSIFAQYLEQYYNDYSISDEEFFSLTYSKTATSIMSAGTLSAGDVAAIVATVAVVVVIVVVLVYNSRKKKQEREAAEDEERRRRADDVANTQYKKYENDFDADVEETAKKYE